MLAEHGFDSYGIDLSQTAIEAAEKHASLHLDPQSSVAKHVHFVKADFFQNNWIHGLSIEGGQFDLVYDYTVGFVIGTHKGFILLTNSSI